MKVTVFPGERRGTLAAIASKSQAHRLLIGAALADRPTRLLHMGNSKDITATMDCLSALGAVFRREGDQVAVTPLNPAVLPEACRLPCGESGSTLRFLLPVVCALGVTGTFQMEGRLPQRPLSPLDQVMIQHGAELTRPAPHLLKISGKLRPGRYTLPGDISSQYVSGLLFALPLLEGESTLTVTGSVESADYIAMTLRTQQAYGAAPIQTGWTFAIPGPLPYRSPGALSVEGDWSNAAFWLCAGAMPGGALTVNGLDGESLQGDRQVWDILGRMGAVCTQTADGFSVREGERRAVEIDAAPIPDLVPALAAVAAVSQGTTRVVNAGRLRLKESDRLAAVAQTLHALGAEITETGEGLSIQGLSRLTGGTVDAWGDHRIAMMAAVAAAACQEPVTITGAQAVEKSYPRFWDDLETLGTRVVREETP